MKTLISVVILLLTSPSYAFLDQVSNLFEAMGTLKSEYKTSGDKAWVLSVPITVKNSSTDSLGSYQSFFGCIPGSNKEIADIMLDFQNQKLQQLIKINKDTPHLHIGSFPNIQSHPFNSMDTCIDFLSVGAFRDTPLDSVSEDLVKPLATTITNKGTPYRAFWLVGSISHISPDEYLELIRNGDDPTGFLESDSAVSEESTELDLSSELDKLQQLQNFVKEIDQIDEQLVELAKVVFNAIDYSIHQSVLDLMMKGNIQSIMEAQFLDGERRLPKLDAYKAYIRYVTIIANSSKQIGCEETPDDKVCKIIPKVNTLRNERRILLEALDLLGNEKK